MGPHSRPSPLSSCTHIHHVATRAPIVHMSNVLHRRTASTRKRHHARSRCPSPPCFVLPRALMLVQRRLEYKERKTRTPMEGIAQTGERRCCRGKSWFGRFFWVSSSRISSEYSHMWGWTRPLSLRQTLPKLGSPCPSNQTTKKYEEGFKNLSNQTCMCF